MQGPSASAGKNKALCRWFQATMASPESFWCASVLAQAWQGSYPFCVPSLPGKGPSQWWLQEGRSAIQGPPSNACGALSTRGPMVPRHLGTVARPCPGPCLVTSLALPASPPS